MAAPVIVTMGVSGCGKSSIGRALAAALSVPFIEGDALHPPRNVALMSAGTPLTDDDRRVWLDAIAARLAAHATHGVVVSCSALKRAYRDRLRTEAPSVRFVHLHGSRELLEQRVRARQGHYMPASLLQSQLETLEVPGADEKPIEADIAESPERIVAAILAQLAPAGAVKDAGTFRLDGRVALVTGSSTGIGLAIARGLARAGAVVVLNGRSAERLDAARTALAAQGLPVQQRIFDVGDEAAVDAAIADIEASIGPLAIVVNNAGITHRAPIGELKADAWRAVMRTNVDSAFYVGRAAARAMMPRRAGRIINVCSIMADVGRPGTSAYTTSKGALKMLTKAMAIDLAPHGITVNALAPGYFRTELTEALAADAALSSWISGRTPLGRWGHVDELAPAAVFLASDAASYVNGHLLVVDGGMTATL